MVRAFGAREGIRRTNAHIILAVLSLLPLLFLGPPNLAYSQLPLSTGAPYAGQKAPGFTLPDQQGKAVSLSGLLKPGGTAKVNGVVLIFYRGYW